MSNSTVTASPPVEHWLLDLGFVEQERIGQSRVFTRGSLRASVSRVDASMTYMHAGHIGQESYTLRYVDLPTTPEALRAMLGAIGRIDDAPLPELPPRREYRAHRDYPGPYNPRSAAEAVWDEIRRLGPDQGEAIMRRIEQALSDAHRAGTMHLYIFTPLVHAPWGEMLVYVAVRAMSFFDAQREAVWELRDWQRSQAEMGRADFPWLDQAIQRVEEMQAAAYMGHAEFDRNKVSVIWYDQREPI